MNALKLVALGLKLLIIVTLLFASGIARAHVL